MNDVKDVEALFGSRVFTRATMRERLPKNVYKEVIKAMDCGGELSPATADVVAKAMKDWAVENGATHYTHWFQPLTGITAEKHDSFITHPDVDGKMLMEFSGKELIKGEPDASSFPSGGLRATFEARGYTAWDITSPAFLREDATGVILCIPTAFCSYKGEALDTKTPLLRSMEAISQQALRIVRLFGNTEATRVIPSVGAEQEYFLVDRDNYLKREDLIFAGRTLFGAPAPKGQEMDDHYFGTIRERIGAYMKDINLELWKLGVTAKTQHNEAAPAQHELAPIYETANVAVDHNQLIMETMKKVAERHNLTCLLHEKPYAGVNGSGKHNNWSLTTDNGVNMLDPGETPNENIQFLLVLACIIKAVDVHADLLRQSASDVGNDHRLGGYEAPPAIMSVFLGEQLEDVVKQLVETGEASHCLEGGKMETGVSAIPDFAKDATDRNRTSPFAFTGNRFEFRATGSSYTCAAPLTVINTAMAEELIQFKKEVDKLIDKGIKKDEAILQVIRKYIIASKKIRFEGNGYSQEWLDEAARRGLEGISSIPEAFKLFNRPEYKKLLLKHGVYSESEIHARYEINLEILIKKIQIESRVLADMAANHIVPTAIKYQNILIQNVQGLKDIMPEEYQELASEEILTISKIAKYVKSIREHNRQMINARKKYNNTEDIEERANGYWNEVRPIMMVIRQAIDKLELIVDDELWPLPKYREMMTIN